MLRLRQERQRGVHVIDSHEHRALLSAAFAPPNPTGYRRTGIRQIESCACGATRHVWITTFKVDAGAWDTASESKGR